MTCMIMGNFALKEFWTQTSHPSSCLFAQISMFNNSSEYEMCTPNTIFSSDIYNVFQLPFVDSIDIIQVLHCSVLYWVIWPSLGLVSLIWRLIKPNFRPSDICTHSNYIQTQILFTLVGFIGYDHTVQMDTLCISQPYRTFVFLFHLTYHLILESNNKNEQI